MPPAKSAGGTALERRHRRACRDLPVTSPKGRVWDQYIRRGPFAGVTLSFPVSAKQFRAFDSDSISDMTGVSRERTPRPLLRGRFHLFAAFAAVAGLVALVWLAHSPRTYV